MTSMAESGLPANDAGTMFSPAGSRTLVATRLARLRAARRHTLDSLADESGVSRAFISQIETERANPTLATLDRLAVSLGVRTADLLSDTDVDPDFEPVIRRARPVGEWPDGTGRTYQLSAPEGHRFAVHLTDGAAADHGRWVEHPGEEFLLVLSGLYRLQLGTDDLRLEAGQSAHYPSSRPHRISHVTAGGRFLLAFGPPAEPT